MTTIRVETPLTSVIDDAATYVVLAGGEVVR